MIFMFFPLYTPLFKGGRGGAESLGGVYAESAAESAAGVVAESALANCRVPVMQVQNCGAEIHALWRPERRNFLGAPQPLTTGLYSTISIMMMP